MALARGEASDASDIDLVAIYDDLDYDERWKRRCALKARARAATGCDVDVSDAVARLTVSARPGVDEADAAADS